MVTDVHYCILEAVCFEERGISIHMQISGRVFWSLAVTDLPSLFKYPYLGPVGGSSSLNFHKSLLGIQEQWVESNKQFGAASVVKKGIRIYVSIIYSSETYSYSDPQGYECSFSNCVGKPEKFWKSTGFEIVTSQRQCTTITNWPMKPQMVRAGQLKPWIFQASLGNC